MPKAVWTGSISFGLVTLPVRLFPATEPKDVRFHLYDASGRRVRYRRVVEDEAPWPATEPAPEASSRPPARVDDRGADAEEDATSAPRVAEPSATGAGPEPASGGEVAWQDVARGVEDELGRVVLLSRDEYERASPERSRTIDVEDFVRLDDIDPVYFEKSYYLAPASPDAVRPYVLLRRALEDAGRIGIGRFVLRTRPHLVAIRPTRGVLGLETLFFGDEVREPSAVVPGIEGVEVSERELELAHRLIETLETEWDPNAYADTYREDLLRMLSEKQPARAVEAFAEAEGGEDRSSAVEALMAALRESVEAAKQRSTPAKGSSGKKRTTAGKASASKRTASASRSKKGA